MVVVVLAAPAVGPPGRGETVPVVGRPVGRPNGLVDDDALAPAGVMRPALAAAVAHAREPRTPAVPFQVDRRPTATGVPRVVSLLRTLGPTLPFHSLVAYPNRKLCWRGSYAYALTLQHVSALDGFCLIGLLSL